MDAARVARLIILAVPPLSFIVYTLVRIAWHYRDGRDKIHSSVVVHQFNKRLL